MKKTGGPERNVFLFVDDQNYEYAGEWEWQLHSDAICCSDVMFAFPDGFEGTKGIIHPDDKALVQAGINSGEPFIKFLQFRIITTYGDIKMLAGKNLRAPETSLLLSNNAAETSWQTEKQIDTQPPQALLAQHRAGELTERVLASGTWHYDTERNEVYYSDEVFRIYGLPRQSLNAHLNTFTPFIHADDRDIVVDAFAKAVRERIPLHIEYRVATPDGQEKTVRQITHWEYNDRGGLMLYGMVQDTTEQNALEQKLAGADTEARFTNRLLQVHEQAAHLGHWYMNLLTRKIFYSDGMYRLHGLKPGAISTGSTVFLDSVHPEDREVVKQVHHKILQQHTPPDLDFRIVRPDGKVRHLRQRGKLVAYAESEMVMIVTVEDVTIEISTSQKLAELKEQLALQQAAQHQAEKMANIGSWLWEWEADRVTWSENLYSLLATKPAAGDVTQKHMLRAIHPDDRKRFSEELQLTVQEKRETRFEIRLIRLGEMRQMIASFKIVLYGGREVLAGTLQDITQHNLLNETLQKQVQLAASITDNMIDRAAITDSENIIRLWNRRCAEAYGLKEEQVLGRNIFDVLPLLKNEEDIKLFNRALNGEAIVISNTKAILRNEYHDQHLIPLRGEDEKVNGILHLIHDVTKERDIRQQLHQRLNFIESLMEASVDRIVVMDRYMNYLYCNQKAAAFFNLHKEDIIGKNVLEIFPGSVNDASHEHFKKALKGDTVHIPAIEGISEEHYYEVFLIPILNEGSDVSAVLWIHHDLSREIKLQRKLKKSDEILNTINISFIELDSEYRFKYISPRAEVLLKKGKDELLGKNIWDEYPQLVGEEGYNLIKRANTEKTTAEAEYFSPNINRWVFTSAVPTADGVIAFQYDRHDIKEAEQRLQAEHRRLKEAQAVGQVGSFEWVVGASHTQWSDELYRINGLEPQCEEMTIAKVHDFIHPDDVAAFENIQQASLEKSGRYRHIHRIVRRNGDVRWVDHQWECISNDNKTVIKVTGVVQDITERKKTEAELFKNLRLLKQAEDVGNMGSWEYCIDEDKIMWSEGMYNLFDLEQGTDVKKETYVDFADKAELPIVKKLLKQFRTGADNMDETLSIVTKKGTQKTLRIKAVSVKDVSGKPTHMLGVDLDITELVRAEQSLKMANRSLDLRNKELQAKNDELANFSFIASHDLREPLRKIHTFSDWLLKREAEHLSDTGRNYLERMQLSVTRMDLLIEDVLILTKLNTTTQAFDLTDLNVVASNVKAEFAEMIEATNAVLDVKKLQPLTGEKTQLYQLFKNLISNGLKFQKQNAVPHLTISSEKATDNEIIELGLDAERTYHKICFRDNGIGFEKNQSEKIFQIFQRLHGRAEYDGTGIGLTICKKVMSNHGGAISVESTPGKGSVFCCFFPFG